jgi:hypothetical protein
MVVLFVRVTLVIRMTCESQVDLPAKAYRVSFIIAIPNKQAT